MKSLLKILLVYMVLTSCSSSEELAVTSIRLGKDTVSVSLNTESLFNPDGLVKRSVLLEFPGNDVQEFEIHNAHYSDMVYLKKLEASGKAYLIAEDKTGYTVWDFNKRRVVAQDDMENNELVKDPSGTAQDYMTHTALNKNQWLKVLGVRSTRKANIAEIAWQ